jgi:hypothetical protein
MRFPPYLRTAGPPPPTSAGKSYLPATPLRKCKDAKGRYPLAPASHSPVFRASLVQTSAALRPFHFRCAPVARVGTSADYIHLYHGNAALLTESLEVIQKTSSAILSALETPLDEEPAAERKTGGQSEDN